MKKTRLIAISATLLFITVVALAYHYLAIGSQFAIFNTTSDKVALTTIKPSNEKWVGIQIQLRSIPFDMRILWEPWMEDVNSYEKELRELEAKRKAMQKEGEIGWSKIIQSEELKGQFIAYTDNHIKTISENIEKYKSERKSKQDLIDMIPEDAFVFKGKEFQGEIVERLKENLRTNVAVTDDIIILFETQIKVKNGTLQSVKNKNITDAINSANDEDTLSLIIEWHELGYEKILKQSKDIYNQLELESAR